MTTVGRYELLEKVARGARTIVYKGRDTRSDREVAVKVVDPKCDCEQGFPAEFIERGRLLAGLDHPHIVGVLEVRSDIPALVMEWVAGASVSDHLTRRIFPVEWSVEIVDQVLSALQYLHEQVLTVRLIPLRDILVEGAPDRPIVKLIDLDCVRVPDRVWDLDQGVPCGIAQLAMMAPEQILTNTFDWRTNIHAAGAILYKLVTQQAPYLRTDGAAEIGELARRVLASDIAPMGSLRPDLPPSLEAVVRRALAKEPADRFVSCAAMRRALREAMGHRASA